MKKPIALLTSLTTITAMGTAALSANAAIIKTEPEGFDYYNRYTKYYIDEDGNTAAVDHDYYYYFYDRYEGDYWEYDDEYKYVCLTVSDDADTETLFSILGEETKESNYYTFADNQLAFEYSPDVVYEELYAIAGVEKVELARYMSGSPFHKEMAFFDSWAEDNGIALYDNNLLVSVVQTNPDVTLTPEMFAETGYTVEHIYQHEPGKWSVYFDFASVETPGDFDAEAEKISGVQSASVALAFRTVSMRSLVFDTVVPDEEPTELSTDAEVPTEEPTAPSPTVILSPDYVKGAYNCHFVSTHYYRDENGNYKPVYEDCYLVFTHNCNGGDIYEMGREYRYALVTAENVDVDALHAVLGEESDTDMQTTKENQYLFPYSADVDYRAVYAIAGVEKVELLKTASQNYYHNELRFDENDLWAAENNVDTTQLMMYEVFTDNGLDLPQVLADAGIPIAHAYEFAPGMWHVYVNHLEHPELNELCADMQSVKGISNVIIPVEYTCMYSEYPIPYLVLNPSGDVTGQPATEEPTDAEAPTEEPTDAEVPTEEPTDAEVPTEEPTDAEVPTEEPTDVEVPTEEPTDTEAPTEDPTGELPQTGMPWAGAVQGLAAVLAIGGGALFVESRRKDKNVDENML